MWWWPRGCVGIGHVACMDDSHLPKRLLFVWLQYHSRDLLAAVEGQSEERPEAFWTR